MAKNVPAKAGDVRDTGLIPGLGGSPEGGHGSPLQYFCLENPMNRGAWWATVHGVARVGHDLVSKLLLARAIEINKKLLMILSWGSCEIASKILILGIFGVCSCTSMAYHLDFKLIC